MDFSIGVHRTAWQVIDMAERTLQERTMLCGEGYAHHFEGMMPLSVKSFRGGIASYCTARGRYALDDSGWLIVNDQEHYVIDFRSTTRIYSTVVFFPAGWADIVARVFREREEKLLDEPSDAGCGVEFLETVMPHDERVTPFLHALDQACRGERVTDDWLEQKLRDLLAAMLWSQRDHRRGADRLPASRPATREELFRRVCRGRDFLGAMALQAPSLGDVSRAASLSPYHFQRSFKAVFGETPHDFATARRLEHAQRLLATGDTTATEVALAVGYASYSAFSAAYRQRYATSPAGE
jgi:AraC family transcriptional regulator